MAKENELEQEVKRLKKENKKLKKRNKWLEKNWYKALNRAFNYRDLHLADVRKFVVSL